MIDVPDLVLRLRRFRRQHGWWALARLALSKVALVVPRVGSGAARPPTSRSLVQAAFAACAPLPTFLVPSDGTPRVSLVTDAIGPGSLFGGVGTAMILSAILAEARGARLRVVTRTERARPEGLAAVLEANGLSLSREVEFVHAPFRTGPTSWCDVVRAASHELPLQADEVFVTTSWWTTAATLGSVAPRQVVYLLQEDERTFYPYGDERLRCEQLLRRPDLNVVVNTRLLRESVLANGCAHLAESSVSFEPAFPSALFHRRGRPAAGPRTLMFYARPGHPRNLFLFGLQVLDAAVTRGVLDPEVWDLVMVGRDVPPVVVGDGWVPRRCEGLSWREYAELAGTVDLALCLMYSPHPSYPPLDVAASGGVAVTNRLGVKSCLDHLSRNVICADLDLDSMVEALAQGVRLALDEGERAANEADSGLARDWGTTLEPVLTWLGARLA